MQEKFTFDSYTSSKDVTKILNPIIKLIKSNKISLAEKKIALMAVGLLNKINKEIISPKKAGKYFMFLDIYLEDNFPKLKLRSKVQDLMHEGMVLHDLGRFYGSDIELMSSLARNIIDGKRRSGKSIWKKINGNWQRRLTKISEN